MEKKRLSLNETIKEIEADLRMGNRAQARAKVDQILNTDVKISRTEVPLLAEIFRRAGRPEASLKLLYKYVRRKGHNQKIATVSEKEEYAGALIHLKAIEEAMDLLKEILPHNSPKTRLFLGMAHINRWDYKSAQKELENFVQFKNVPHYTHYIGVINLLASKVANSSSQKGMELLDEIDHHLEETARLDYRVLHSNLLEIKSQLLLKSLGEKTRSKSILKKAQVLVKDPSAKENLFIQKWEILSRKNPSPKWIKEMEALQEKAILFGHTETIRDSDYHLGEYDEERLLKVFFGTPYPSFRAKILEEFELTLPAAFWFDLPGIFEKKRFEFDYQKYKDLKVGSVVFKTLMVLGQDFYRRQNMYTLFEAIFPGDLLNPETSFNKVHQAISRTRVWLKKKRIPFIIQEENQEYFLTGDVAIKVYLHDRLKSFTEKKEEKLFHELSFLKKSLSEEPFTLHEANSVLRHETLRKTQRFIKKAIEEKEITRMGLGKKTLYTFSK